MTVTGLDELTYYDLLGVEPSVGVDTLRQAFHDFARRYHPDNHTDDPARLARATEIFRRGTEAYRVLLDPELRSAYDRALERGETRLRAGTEPRRGGRRGRALGPRARPFFAAAEQALRAGDRRGALLKLRIALQHEPGSELLRRKLAELEADLKGDPG